MKRKTCEYTLQEWNIDNEYFIIHLSKKPKYINIDSYIASNTIASTKNDFLDTYIQNNKLTALSTLTINNYISNMLTVDDKLLIETYEQFRLYPNSRYFKEINLFYGTSKIFDTHAIVLSFNKITFNKLWSLQEATLLYNLDYTIYQEISEVLYLRTLLINNSLFINNLGRDFRLTENDNYLIYILT